MKLLIRLLIFTALLMLAAHMTRAQEPTAQEIRREHISKIKIISMNVDDILFYLYGKDRAIYRMSSLSQREADQILTRLKDNQILKISTQPVERQPYLEVVDWQ